MKKLHETEDNGVRGRVSRATASLAVLALGGGMILPPERKSRSSGKECTQCGAAIPPGRPRRCKKCRKEKDNAR